MRRYRYLTDKGEDAIFVRVSSDADRAQIPIEMLGPLDLDHIGLRHDPIVLGTQFHGAALVLEAEGIIPAKHLSVLQRENVEVRVSLTSGDPPLTISKVDVGFEKLSEVIDSNEGHVRVLTAHPSGMHETAQGTVPWKPVPWQEKSCCTLILSLIDAFGFHIGKGWIDVPVQSLLACQTFVNETWQPDNSCAESSTNDAQSMAQNAKSLVLYLRVRIVPS